MLGRPAGRYKGKELSPINLLQQPSGDEVLVGRQKIAQCHTRQLYDIYE